MTDIVYCPPNVDCPCYARLVEENAKLREALRLIAEHPVEQSRQWEVGAREMLKLARTTLEHTHDR